ncbi:MAG: hypothetical protein P1U68_16915 [Verrucomicrobiales bacterium]|nr:hypothetical protein [Verrucomicrobiales bacterium]
MKLSPNRLILIVGAFVLALMAVDGLVQLNKAGMAEFGYGESAWVAADSAAAIFMIGLIAGMVLGIAIFFFHLVLRERKLSEEPDELTALFAELEQDEAEENAFFADETAQTEEKSEALDPWERPADWWMREED